MPKALITGITGQDGAYLARLLLHEGYEVFGAKRRSASLNLWRLEEMGIADKIEFVPFELLEYSNIVHCLRSTRPDEVYNLAAHSFVAESFQQPTYVAEINALGPLRILEAIRIVDPEIKFYQASTSEMFGRSGGMQSEVTPFQPCSPYAAAKLHAHWVVQNYREAFGMFAVSGILFNHESRFRGIEFVTRKISAGMAQMRAGRETPIHLGNLEARRDWGYAGDYVLGMWRMMQHRIPSDYILATGKSHSVRDFVGLAAEAADFKIEWPDENTAIDKKTGRNLVMTDPKYDRPLDVMCLQGDAQKARVCLGWKPSISFESLVEDMVAADLGRL